MGRKHKKYQSDFKLDDEKTPLKLVFKLGSEVVYDSDQAANSSSSHGSHKKKKRRKLMNNDDTPDLTSSSEDNTLEAKHDDDDQPMETNELSPDSEVHTDVKDTTSGSDDSDEDEEPPSSVEEVPSLTPEARVALNKLLDNLLEELERKDPHDIFAWPVNDLIAPGYSTMIAYPMDFSTMRNKISTDQYYTVDNFKSDFEVMVQNCCTYNGPDTIFFQAAKKLKTSGNKILSRERLLHLRKTNNYLKLLSAEDASQILNFLVADGAAGTEGNQSSQGTTFPNGKSKYDKQFNVLQNVVSFTDADSPDTVAPDAQAAADAAKMKVSQVNPNGKIAALCSDDGGKTTYLNILNNDANDSQMETTKMLDIGSLTGHIPSGIDVLPPMKEDKRNKITPIEYLSYGPFGSFAPSYDSRVANLTQEESDLLMSTYNGETGYLYAKSLQDFVKDANPVLTYLVDDMLDNLTHGLHRRTLSSLQESRSDSSEAKPNLLDHNSKLIGQLQKEQYERLGKKPPVNQPNLDAPSSKETNIADEIQNNLVEMAKIVKPGLISDQKSIRNAMSSL